MRAADVMVRDVVTIGPDESVARAARLMAEHDASALPVVDAAGGLVGILSEADLLRREEIGTSDRRPKWVETITPATTLAAEFTRSHSLRMAATARTVRTVRVRWDSDVADERALARLVCEWR